MLPYLRSAFLRHTIGFLLISLFTLKMVGTVTAIVKDKHLSNFKICNDSEKSEKEEKKDPEKQQKKNIEFFTKNDESYLRTIKKRDGNAESAHRFANCIPHFGSVPSPPPDLIC